MQRLLSLSIFFLCFLCADVNAQGVITGTVKDLETNEPLLFANVLVKGGTTGTTTDFDGVYALALPEGIYTFVVSYIGYGDMTVTDIEVKADETTELDILLSSSVELDEVVVSAEVLKNTDAAVLNIRKTAIQLLDGISSQSFKRIGAGNLAAAVKNVPGVTIQSGKYVYVRGLGDRYTKTTLNSMTVPGLDPDKNTLQMDIFSTSILDNVLVSKSFTADLSADFTGGLVNIVTKAFPTEKTYDLSIGVAFNPTMHFNSNYRNYAGGKTDMLGFDDGIRARPISENTTIPFTFDRDPALNSLTKEFNPNMASTMANSGLNYNFGFTTGNQLTVGDNNNKLGYIASINYKNSTSFYENAINNTIGTITDGEIRGKFQEGVLGNNNVILSGLAGMAFKTTAAKYKLNFLHIQNGESESGLFTQLNNDSDFVTFKKDYLAYTQRSISNVLLSGVHYKNDDAFKVEWNVSSTFSSIHDKDIRTTAFRVEDEGFSITQNVEPTRIWRDLKEQNHNAKLDFTSKHILLNKGAKLKFGVAGLYKLRNFNIFRYQIGIKGSTSIFDGDADALLQEDNLWTVENDQGTFIRNTTVMDPANQFESNQTNLAAYISEEISLNDKFRGIVGVRMEKYNHNYTGENSTGLSFNNEAIIDKLDVFPSLNLIYELRPDNKLRFSSSITTARPSFKEASIAEIYDPLSNITFIGNTNLKPSYIYNFDLRYELYFDQAQLFIISAFFKDFKDPIELTYFQAAPDNFTPANLGKASVYGVELESSKNFDFLSPSLEKLRFRFNASLTKSILEMGADEIALRQNTAQDGEVIGTTRSLQGQAPYSINAGFDYLLTETGLEVGLHYNVQGETLEVVGGVAPDVFSVPFHDLRFTLSKKLGRDKKSTINLKVANLLGQERSSVYHIYNSTDLAFRSRKIGTTISVGCKFHL